MMEGHRAELGIVSKGPVGIREALGTVGGVFLELLLFISLDLLSAALLNLWCLQVRAQPLKAPQGPSSAASAARLMAWERADGRDVKGKW